MHIMCIFIYAEFLHEWIKESVTITYAYVCTYAILNVCRLLSCEIMQWGLPDNQNVQMVFIWQATLLQCNYIVWPIMDWEVYLDHFCMLPFLLVAHLTWCGRMLFNRQRQEAMRTGLHPLDYYESINVYANSKLKFQQISQFALLTS